MPLSPGLPWTSLLPEWVVEAGPKTIPVLGLHVLRAG